MPKTKKKAATKKVSKKTVKKAAPKKAMQTQKTPATKQTSFSTEFMNALLVVFAAGLMLFSYVIFRIYG